MQKSIDGADSVRHDSVIDSQSVSAAQEVQVLFLRFITASRVSLIGMFFGLISYGFFMHGKILPAIVFISMLWLVEELADAYIKHRQEKDQIEEYPPPSRHP